MWFQWRCCKHCHHTLKYRGVKEEDGQEYYLFSCNHCGNWEQVPKEEFFRQYDNPVNKDNKKHGKTSNS